MKKMFILLYLVLVSSTFAFASGDFIQFTPPMSRNDWYYNAMQNDINSTLNTMNRNNWSNPYDYNDFGSSLSSLFKQRNLNNKLNKYSSKPLNDSDIEYLLTKMEKNRFGLTYKNLDVNTRLDRLDAQMFGAIQDGDYKTRLNRLKHAFAAESTRECKAKNERVKGFKSFFSSGRPTSIPVDEDYYSSLNNSLY